MIDTLCLMLHYVISSKPNKPLRKLYWALVYDLTAQKVFAGCLFSKQISEKKQSMQLQVKIK